LKKAFKFDFSRGETAHWAELANKPSKTKTMK
jgi:hypothetical protein